MTQSTLHTQRPSLPSHPPPAPRRAPPDKRPPPRRVRAQAGLILALWLLGTPGGVYGKADAIGYAVCHRIADRSFHVDGRPLPLCARCTGIYMGAMSSLAVLVAARRGRASRLPPNRVLVALGAFVVLMGLDGINSYLYLFPGYVGPYQPQNWLRLLTGSFTGIALIHLLFPIFNALAWQRPAPQRPLNSLAELAGMLAVVGLVDTLILLQNPTLLLAFGLVSAAGPLIVLTMVWTALFLSLTRRENAARSWRDLALPLVAGLALTFLMIGSIDTVRFLLTGTWEGFDFSALARP